MKKFSLLLILLFSLSPCNQAVAGFFQDFKVYVFGVDIELYKDKNWGLITLGALSSILTHEMGHYLSARALGKKSEIYIYPEGMACKIEDDKAFDEHSAVLFNQCGFMLQIGIGALLSATPGIKKSDFTLGWVSINVFQTYSYELRHPKDGDFNNIKKHNWDWENFSKIVKTFSLLNYNSIADSDQKCGLLNIVTDGSDNSYELLKNYNNYQ